jgi:hypothetical protein
MSIPFQIGQLDVRYQDFVNDRPDIPAHIQRYRIVGTGWENEPNAEVLGYAVSRYDLPDNKTKLYPLIAYTRLLERLGLPVDESALEKQWTNRFRRVYSQRPRKKIDVKGQSYYQYYKNLILWCRKEPKTPEMTQVLKKLIQSYGGKTAKDACMYYHGYHNTVEKRKELRKKWDSFVEQYKRYKNEYEKWFASKPERTGIVADMSDEPMYVLDSDMWVTKRQIELIERMQPTKALLILKHPFTGNMAVVLDIGGMMEDYRCKECGSTLETIDEDGMLVIKPCACQKQTTDDQTDNQSEDEEEGEEEGEEEEVE